MAKTHLGDVNTIFHDSVHLIEDIRASQILWITQPSSTVERESIDTTAAITTAAIDAEADSGIVLDTGDASANNPPAISPEVDMEEGEDDDDDGDSDFDPEDEEGELQEQEDADEYDDSDDGEDDEEDDGSDFESEDEGEVQEQEEGDDDDEDDDDDADATIIAEYGRRHYDNNGLLIGPEHDWVRLLPERLHMAEGLLGSVQVLRDRLNDLHSEGVELFCSCR